MNLKFLIDCCFPKSKEIITINHQESFKEKEDKEEVNATGDKKLDSDTASNEKNDNIEKPEEHSYQAYDLKVQMSKECDADNTPKFCTFAKYDDHSPRTKGSNKYISSNYSGGFPVVNYYVNHSLVSHKSQSAFETSQEPKQIEEFSLDLMNLNRIITEGDLKTAPELILEEIEGDLLKNNKLRIVATGLFNSARKILDGVVYFGTYIHNNENIAVNDFALNMVTKTNSQNVFIVYYHKEYQKYFIKSTKDNSEKLSSVVLVKLAKSRSIKRPEIFLIGNLLFQITPIGEILEVVKVISKNSPDKMVFKFYPDSKSVTIGRDKSCSINFEKNKSFSKINTSIVWDKKDQCWKITDGANEKSSTNGTWLYASHSCEIYNNMIFKIGNCKLKFTFAYNQ